jgi:hypothetical protein
MLITWQPKVSLSYSLHSLHNKEQWVAVVPAVLVEEEGAEAEEDRVGVLEVLLLVVPIFPQNK